MKVLVAEKLAPEGVALLQQDHEVDVRIGMSREEYLEALPEYEALLVRSGVKADAEAIAAGKKLIVIGRAGVGVDNIDIPAATKAGITVVNAPTGNTTAAAEHTIALLFALSRNISAADASMHAGNWDRSAFMGRELVDKTLGVIGLGKIGMAVAKRARALDMEVVGYDPFVTEQAAGLHGIRLLPVAASGANRVDAAASGKLTLPTTTSRPRTDPAHRGTAATKTPRPSPLSEGLFSAHGDQPRIPSSLIRAR